MFHTHKLVKTLIKDLSCFEDSNPTFQRKEVSKHGNGGNYSRSQQLKNGSQKSVNEGGGKSHLIKSEKWYSRSVR
jgi:hypothetical protein